MPEGETNLSALWDAVDLLLENASLSGILTHKLGPLAASRLRRLGRPLPPVLAAEERAASLGMLTAIPFMEHIRASSDGTLVILKGPEVARLYPGAARSFSDIDLLVDDAEGVHRALVGKGLVERYDALFDPEGPHLVPLEWTTIALQVDIHKTPRWPVWLGPPPTREILEASVPSALGVVGVSTPTPCHHALILAAHGWEHEPLRRLLELIDIAVMSAQADERDLNRTATTWGMGHLWRATQRTIDAMFYGGRKTFPLRTWARHLEPVRDRTGFENHLLRLLYGYSARPPLPATAQAVRVVRSVIEPIPGESWSHKVRRVPQALRNLRTPMTRKVRVIHQPNRRQGRPES